jgi:hypothetical protein
MFFLNCCQHIIIEPDHEDEEEEERDKSEEDENKNNTSLTIEQGLTYKTSIIATAMVFENAIPKNIKKSKFKSSSSCAIQ